MIPVLLTHIKARDGVRLDGIAVLPGRTSHTALVWIHGLGSNFAHGQTLAKELSARCARGGIAYFKFNTRGHDIVNRGRGRKLYGSGWEKFEECVPDIRAMIAYARKLGYRKIILAGHSTGANKALYYLYKTRDPAVKGLILLGPVSDTAAGIKKFGRAGLARGITFARRLARRDPRALMPVRYGIFTARRFLSMFRPGSREDVFGYLNPEATWRELGSIRVPVEAIIGSRDQYLDRPAQKIMDIFASRASSTKSFTGVIIKNADHGFRGKETALSRIIGRWIKALLR